MPHSMAAAYADARAYCQLIAKIRPAAGILKILLLRRIGSSLRAGLLTARKLRSGEEAVLVGEEDEGLTREGVADVGSEALAKLDSAIAKMEAAGDDDPKFRVVLNYLRHEGWADRGCILFSQYLTRSSGWPDTLRGLSPRRWSASMAVRQLVPARR